MIDNAVIFAAGRASRMGYCSKAMKEICGKPLITYALDALRYCGIKKIFVICRPNDSEIINLPAIWDYPEVQLELITDSYLQGAVIAHRLLPKTITYPLITLDCDLIVRPISLERTLQECCELFRNPEITAAITVVDNTLFESDRCVRIEGNRVAAYKAKGVPNGVNGGYIFVWRNPIVTEIDEYYDCVQKTGGYESFFEYYLSKWFVAPMHIDYLWDVDTLDMVSRTEEFLRKKCFSNNMVSWKEENNE